MSTPTTIEPLSRSTLVKGGAVALFVWFAGMAAATLIVDPPSAVAFGPQAMRAAVASGAPLVSSGAGFVVVRADAPGLARRLYRHGAWLVWPVLRAGCGIR